MSTVPEICAQLQSEQRYRAMILKRRIMQTNGLTANVAQQLGYKPSDDEDERKQSWGGANDFIDTVRKGTNEPSQLGDFVRAGLIGIEAWEIQENAVQKEIKRLAAQLPVAEWCERKEQRGFGLLSLGMIVGECGDLANYAGPAKVWRRLGMAPFCSRGKTLMGATWKSGREGSLSAEEWSEFGYSPRRRSIMYVIGESLLKGNAEGPYRTRYDQVKERALASREDWTKCKGCDGAGRVNNGKKKCGNCKGEGIVKLRCHRHAMLLMTKLLVKRLWCAWNNQPVIDEAEESLVVSR